MGNGEWGNQKIKKQSNSNMKKQIFTLGLLCLSTLGLAQGNQRLRAAGNSETDTLIANVLRKDGGTGDQILIANGSVATLGTGLRLEEGIITTGFQLTPAMQAGLSLKLDRADSTRLIRQLVPTRGNHLIRGKKIFNEFRSTKSIGWNNASSTVDWEIVAIDSATYINGIPHRNLVIRTKFPSNISTINKSFTFDPLGNLMAEGFIHAGSGFSSSAKIQTTASILAQQGVRGDTLRTHYLQPIEGILPIETPSFMISHPVYAKLTINSQASTAYLGNSLVRSGDEVWFTGIPGGETANYNYSFTTCQTCRSNGVGIKTLEPSQRLEVNGNMRASGSVIADATTLTSDRRLKSNITDLKLDAIATIKQLRGVEYDKKDSIQSTQKGQHEYGFIAQEVQKILPLLVTAGNDKDQLLHLNYTAFIPILTKAIQEQQALIKTNKSNYLAQKMKVEELIKRVEKLGNR